MNARGSNVLIEAAELASSDPATVIVDCRFNLLEPDAGFRAYLDGHVPGARYAHLDKDLARAPLAHEGRHPLPEPASFAAWLGAVGIARDTPVVVYDDAGGAIAARLWWLLDWLGHADCRILNGGVQAWRAAGGALECDRPVWRPCEYAPVTADWERVVTTSDLTTRLAAGSTLIDARGAARFRGEHEPIDPVAGHIPGAVNLPFDSLLDETKRFRDAEALAGLLAERVPAAPARMPIAMCGSGVTACLVLAALRVTGAQDGLLYAGSWSEWIRDPDRPVANTAD